MAIKLNVKNEQNGRRKFEMTFASLGKFEIFDIPGSNLTKKEWKKIALARKSYQYFWGSFGIIENIKQDPFDGIPPYDKIYTTRHQIAIFTSLNGKKKILTNRKVSINPLNKKSKLFDDIEFWNIVNKKTGQKVTLWEMIRKYIFSNTKVKKDNFRPELFISAISRTGTYPYVISEKSELEHDSTAIAWALMQIAVLHDDKSKLFICQLCSEFQEKVHTISYKGKTVKLNFKKTSDTLGLKSGWELKLDRNNQYLKAHLLNFPGYWLNGREMLKLLINLIKKGQLDNHDFIKPAKTLLKSKEKILLHDNEKVNINNIIINNNISTSNLLDTISLFTKPRYFKYLIPLINTNGKINSKLSGKDLRTRILKEVDERPFSSTFTPSEWEKSVIKLLSVAESKYR